MNRLGRKIGIISIIAVCTVVFISLGYAQVFPKTVNVFAWTDKRQYQPGEKGTLYITVRNDIRDEDYIVKNITIEYPWMSYVKDHWEGNETIPDIDFSLIRKGEKIYNKDITFSVPGDGRAVSGTAKIKVYVDRSPGHFDGSAVVDVINPPVAMAITDINTWMTILTTAIVICTIILASVVFLSTRRPRITTVAARAKA